MAEEKIAMWSATNCDPKDAHALADFMNKGLSKNNKIEVVKLSTSWFALVGNESAKKWFDEMKAEMHKQEKLKEANNG